MKKTISAAIVSILLLPNIVSAQYFGYQFNQPDNSAYQQQQRFNDMEQWMRQREADAQLQRLEQQQRMENFNRRESQQIQRCIQLRGLAVPLC
jgi:hypothetical protein